MSNVTITGGLRLLEQKQPQELMQVVALSGDGTRIGVGDAVKISAAGAIAVGSGPVVMAVTRAAAGDSILGVVEGVLPLTEGTGAINLGIRYRPASTAQYMMVRPANHNDVYVIQDDGASAMTAANIGNNANLAVVDCSTATGMSNMTLGSASAASGNATRQLHIEGYLDSVTNDQTSTGALWKVTLNNIYQAGGTGVVGV